MRDVSELRVSARVGAGCAFIYRSLYNTRHTTITLLFCRALSHSLPALIRSPGRASLAARMARRRGCRTLPDGTHDTPHHLTLSLSPQAPRAIALPLYHTASPSHTHTERKPHSSGFSAGFAHTEITNPSIDYPFSLFLLLRMYRSLYRCVCCRG